MNSSIAFLVLIISFGLSVIIFVPTMILTILVMHKSSLLMEYLHDKHYKKWAYLTSIGYLGPGNVNPFRSIPYLYTSENIKDIKLQALKQRTRFWTTLVGIGYGLILIVNLLNFGTFSFECIVGKCYQFLL